MATYVPARLNIGLGAEREGRPERRRDELDVRLRDGGEQGASMAGPQQGARRERAEGPRDADASAETP